MADQAFYLRKMKSLLFVLLTMACFVFGSCRNAEQANLRVPLCEVVSVINNSSWETNCVIRVYATKDGGRFEMVSKTGGDSSRRAVSRGGVEKVLIDEFRVSIQQDSRWEKHGAIPAYYYNGDDSMRIPPECVLKVLNTISKNR